MIRKFVATLLLIALPALPALAGKPDNPGKGKGKGNSANSHGGGSNKGGSHGNGGGQSSGGGGSHGNDWSDDGGGHYEGPRFSSHDRDYWREYWRGEYEHGNCPPGLAKKHNGCMPPGLAKKRYTIGRPLPADFVVLPVPALLLPRLRPCPPGYYYGMIDGDLVQLAVGTLLVVDAIEGLTN